MHLSLSPCQAVVARLPEVASDDTFCRRVVVKVLQTSSVSSSQDKACPYSCLLRDGNPLVLDTTNSTEKLVTTEAVNTVKPGL